MATRMQQRRGTAATWTAANPILAAGEIGFEIDTNKFKIGDGSNRWANLVYFTADAAAAIQDLIDGAPGMLDTLNELAAALGDDPAFFTTVATNLSNHESDTTNVHGIANTADLATKSYVDTAEADAVATASADATTKANNAKSGAEATAAAALAAAVSDLEDYADQAEADAISTAAADATSKANAAQAAAELTASNALALAVSNLEDYADQSQTDAESFATAADTALYGTVTGDIATAKQEAIDAAEDYTDAAVANLVDGAPALLNTLNELAAAIADNPNYATDVTNLVATKADTSYVDSEISDLNTSLRSYADQAEADAISTASADATSKANAAQSAAVSTASLDATTKANAAQAAAISTASADATSKANAAQAAAISTASADATTKANAAEANAKSYTDSEISDLDVSLKAYADQAEADAISTASADATSKANAARSAAEATAASALSSHESDTTNVHGIADTSILVTTTGTQTLTNKSLTSPVISSPAMTGVPSAPTAELGTSSTQVATTAFVDAAIEALGSRNLVLDGGGV